MATRSAKNEGREISPREFKLGDDFGPAVVSVNGISLTIDADGRPTLKTSGDATVIANGNITAYSKDGDVTAHTNGIVHQLRSICHKQDDAPANVTKQAYNIGDILPDGWVVGPVSPDTGIVMSIEPVSDALEGYKTWHQGQDHATELRGKGNAHARQPSDSELNALYNGVVKAGRNQNAQFNTSGSSPYARYWSSTPDGNHLSDLARVQYFDDGDRRHRHFKDQAAVRVRCVRDEPGLTLA